MSERIIVVENCEECPYSGVRFLIPEDRVCYKMFSKHGERVCPDEGTPVWCPLPRLQYLDVYDVEKHNQEIEDWLDNGSCSSIGEVFTQIWNACFDAIIGEEEE